MSSLKDWYRYVDSKARSRPEETGSPERERPTEAREEGRPPAETSAADRERAGLAGEPAGEVDPAQATTGPSDTEENFDIWGGLFPQPRKPEPKPTTAPLRRPTARLDEVPADLPFTRTPIDGPPPPQFEMPEGEVEIPRFDEFVSPFTAETAPSPSAAAPAPSAGTPPGQPPGDASQPSLSEESPSPAAVLPDQEPPPAAIHGEADTVTPPEHTPMSEVWGGEDVEGEEGQLRWRSPFRLPGPGRTVSSGAPSPRPEPVAPRQIPDLTASLEAALAETTAADPTPPRPAPGTEAWEQERVERLARTFRDTLRALEESLGGSPAPASRPPAEAAVDAPPPMVESPMPEVVDPRPAAIEDQASGLVDWLRAPEELSAPEPEPMPVVSAPPSASSAPAPAVSAAAPTSQPAEPEALPVAGPLAPQATSAPFIEAPPAAEALSAPQAALRREEAPIGEIATDPDRKPRHDGMLPAPAAIFDAVAATPAATASTPDEDRPVAPSPRRPVSAATPDVLRNIEEAALIRQRLPQHMAMLLRIPTNEVAQNSYKSPFRETREDLIGRLLDPQLTLEEAARMLGVCPTTVRRYTNRGMLHCHRTPGNQRRFRMSDVLQFLEQYGDRIDRAAEARQMENAA